MDNKFTSLQNITESPKGGKYTVPKAARYRKAKLYHYS